MTHEKTDRNETIVRRYLNGENPADIGRSYGITHQRVHQIIGQAEVDRRIPDFYLHIHLGDEIEEALTREGATLKQAADECGVSVSTVQRVKRNRGLRSGHEQAKRAREKEIVRLYTEEKMKQVDIAERLGVWQSTVSATLRQNGFYRHRTKGDY